MSTQAPVVQVTHAFRASAERVFDAWIDPRMASRFLFATDAGTIVRCDIDARVGGRFTIVDRRDEGDVEHTGEYLEIDRPRRLVFIFGVPKYSSAFDRVEIDVVPRESGCELTLTHTLAPEAAEWADRSAHGWATILTNLDRLLS